MSKKVSKPSTKAKRPIKLREMVFSPPQFKAQIVRPMRIRTLATAGAGNQQWSYIDLAGLLGVVATAATTSVFLATCFRLRRMEYWNPQTAIGTSNTVDHTWINSSADYVTPPITVSDTSSSSDRVAHMIVIPPEGSLNDKWHSSSQVDVCFSNSFSTGATVDFQFDWVLLDDGGPQAGPTLAGATLGKIYHKSVHGLAVISLNAI